MKITILNGNPDGGNTTFDTYLERLAGTLATTQHQTTALTLRDMDIKYCTGCWSCWVKTPGECIARDDSVDACRAVINADFVLLASPVTMGFPSAVLKKTVEKFIPLIHPYGAVVQGEAHHMARYDKYPLMGLLLEKHSDTDDADMQITADIFSRTALNFKTQLALAELTSTPADVVAETIANARPLPNWTTPLQPTAIVPDVRRYAGPPPTRLTVFNGSPRGKTGNTQIMLEQFAGGFEANAGRSHETYYLNRASNAERSRQAFAEAEHVLLGFPLYADAMPGIVKAFIETLEPFCGRENNPSIGFLVQSGFPEAIHSRYVERYLEKLSVRLGCPYSGTIVKGNGEGVRYTPPEKNRALFETLHQLGATYGQTGQFDPVLLGKLAKPERFPKWMAPVFRVMLKTKIANMMWDNSLKENGAYERRFAKPYAQ
ncbi:MAG: flavodoxin family protein [Anaerolineae bacterium]|nr:flavodoxin family protein [Anaerolineae bacterium]